MLDLLEFCALLDIVDEAAGCFFNISLHYYTSSLFPRSDLFCFFFTLRCVPVNMRPMLLYVNYEYELQKIQRGRMEERCSATTPFIESKWQDAKFVKTIFEIWWWISLKYTFKHNYIIYTRFKFMACLFIYKSFTRFGRRNVFFLLHVSLTNLSCWLRFKRSIRGMKALPTIRIIHFGWMKSNNSIRPHNTSYACYI